MLESPLLNRRRVASGSWPDDVRLSDIEERSTCKHEGCWRGHSLKDPRERCGSLDMAP
jgi:hypothetical protein